MTIITKSLEWIPLPGFDRNRVLEEVTRGAVDHRDMGDHVWVATINNLGTMLYCYGVQPGEYEHNGRKINVWYVKRIPESVGPDIYDCPRDLMEMCRITNVQWRQRVLESIDVSR